jgi:hypothetical protein
MLFLSVKWKGIPTLLKILDCLIIKRWCGMKLSIIECLLKCICFLCKCCKKSDTTNPNKENEKITKS